MLAPQKNLDEFEAVFAQSTQFFSTYNPDMIEEALLKYLKEEFMCEAKVNHGKYKMKFTVTIKDQYGKD